MNVSVTSGCRRDFWADGDLPATEANATNIMQMPFHHSPRRKFQDPAFNDVPRP